MRAESLFVLIFLLFVPKAFCDQRAAGSGWNMATQGAFVMSGAYGASGDLWIGTEDNGVSRLGVGSDPKWTRFTQRSGLADDCGYAVACDNRGRIWVGSRNRGIAVYNGDTWRSYSLETGFSGSRVFAIAVCRPTSDVWIACDSGLVRYVDRTGVWRDYFVGNGFASSEASGIAFDASGNIYVATQCDGVYIAFARDDYRAWRHVTASHSATEDQVGPGLPSNDTNGVIVTRSGTVLVATNCGLGVSADQGAAWTFIRGSDWQDNIAGKNVTSIDEATVSGIDIIPVDSSQPGAAAKEVSVACGFFDPLSPVSDRFFIGGSARSTRMKVQVDGVENAAPLWVYQRQRCGKQFHYTVSGLVPGVAYYVRLHFVETQVDKAGGRRFSVTVNGDEFLRDVDIFSEAGGRQNRAVVEQVACTAGADGVIEIAFKGDWRMPSYDPKLPLLAEDCVTSVAEDASGYLWIGHRTKGVEVVDSKTFRSVDVDSTATSYDFATMLLPSPDGSVYIGWYGNGLTRCPAVSPAPMREQTAENAATVTTKLADMPADPAVPSFIDMNRMADEVDAQTRSGSQAGAGWVVALEDDWRTNGDWLGRYGRYWACLCAICSPRSYTWGAGWEPVDYKLRIGPNCKPGDSLRYWIHWLYSSNPKVLELPPTYLDSRILRGLTTMGKPRRQAECDDRGEAYPASNNGPNIYCCLSIPKGIYYLSLYEFNKDGTIGRNRIRDYAISVRAHSPDRNLKDISDFSQQAELARGRIVNFWGGVWKRFLVEGPTRLTIEINRSHTFNTILPMVALDLTDERPAPYFCTPVEWTMIDKRERAQAAETTPGSSGERFALTDDAAADRLFQSLCRARLLNPRWWALHKQPYYLGLYHWYSRQFSAIPPGVAPTNKLLARLATCSYELQMFDQWENYLAKLGDTSARQIEKALRWDGVSQQGQDYQVVTKYLQRHAGVRAHVAVN